MKPIQEDIAEAESIYDNFVGRFGMKHERKDYVAVLARAAMHKRRHLEYKKKLQDVTR